MSGYIVIFSLNGNPVSHSRVEALTESLRFRGPDAQNVWTAQETGLGHALLKMEQGGDIKPQPLTIDGNSWIVGDARVDAREELATKLRGRHSRPPTSYSDAELLLHAYNQWGEQCVDHVIGDFSFAIWDVARQHLFCARDHFGIRPLYYSRTDSCIIVSNTVDCIYRHPSVDLNIDEESARDFLLFGTLVDQEATIFEQIRRLPPAHTLLCSKSTFRTRKYWQLPVDQRIRYRNDHEYVEHFRHLLREAVHDRLRAKDVGIFMSGGLDSTSIAAEVQSLVGAGEVDCTLDAYTVVYNQLIPDDEAHYARLVAERLGIPLHIITADRFKLLGGSIDSNSWLPYLENRLLPGLAEAQYTALTEDGKKIVLWGTAGTEHILHQSRRWHFKRYLRRLEFGPVIREGARYLWEKKRIPPYSTNTTVRESNVDLSWFDEAFARRTHAGERWEEVSEVGPYYPGDLAEHPVHSESYRIMTQMGYVRIFEGMSPVMTRRKIQPAYPYMDLRMINYTLGLPPLPWCIDKRIIRQAMADMLPREVLGREKTPVQGDSIQARIERGDIDAFGAGALSELARQYMDTTALPESVRGVPTSLRNSYLRILQFDRWLRTMEQQLESKAAPVSEA